VTTASTALARSELSRFIRRSRRRPLRSLRAFAEAEIVIPSGPFQGRRFRWQRQPYTRLWLDAVDSGNWNRFVTTGPTQSGKTLACFVIPLLYHLFEVGETVICGLPDMDMAVDKWRLDLLPVIEASRYRKYLPRHGAGSRGGRFEAIQFAHGPTLKFMSGGGGDKSRAGFTARVVVITETDGLDRAGATSRESDKITQLEARTRAYGARKRIYLECTVSTEEGRTWREYTAGTRSRIVLECPHCARWVAPDRPHLQGWQDASSFVEAREAGRFTCPECNAAWTEDERTAANRAGRLLHEGEEVDEKGELVGEAKPTDTLGFRWSAVHNLFVSAGDVAADEWRAARSHDEENAEKEMRQFVWCIPVAPSAWQETRLEADQIARRTRTLPRGLVPNEASCLTAAIDLGKYLTHWIVVAWSDGASAHVVDYGRIEVATDDLGLEQALLVALRQFRDFVMAGWPKAESPDDRLVPRSVWIDAGYQPEVVYRFCREVRPPFGPALGRGASQQPRSIQHRSARSGSKVKQIGEGYCVCEIEHERMGVAEVDADYWKTWLSQRLSTPHDQPGAMTLFQAPPSEHLALSKHLTAERRVEEFLPGRGVVTRWERVRRQNHWLDALYNACAAGHFVGVRLFEPAPAEPVRRRRRVSVDQEGLDPRRSRVWEGDFSAR